MVYVSAQAAVQRKLKPASWLPGVRNFHSEEQEWTFNVDVSTAMDQVWAAAGKLEGFKPIRMDKEKMTMVVDFFTKVKWLDEMVFKFSKLGDSQSKCWVEDCSTGFLPLSIPAAPLVNVVLCFFPFGDNNKCSQTMNILRTKVETEFGTVVTPKTLRFSVTNYNKAEQKKTEQALSNKTDS